MRKKRCSIFIDGSNFYFKLKDLNLHHLLGFNFTGFAGFLAKADSVINTIYYVGAVKTDGSKKSQERFNNQRKLLARLKQHHVQYSLGYLLKTNNRYHEKGVDVAIACDILIAAYENTCDRIILVSSDTDLIPAIKKAKEKGKIIEYIGFSHQPSLALIANCTASRLLSKEDLLPYLPKKQ